MRIHSLVWKEFVHRPLPMLTSLLAVALGVTALVSVQSMAASSGERVASQLEQLGANVLVLPSTATLQDYYAADMHGGTLPEEYVTRLALARKVGVDDLAPKLCVQTSLNEKPVVLTGILPRADFQAKAAWSSVGMVTDGLSPVGTAHQGCQGKHHFSSIDEADPRSLTTTRVVQHLDKQAALVGADVALRHGLQAGDRIELYGAAFHVAAILPATGTVDDGRIFAHLHTVQDLAETGPVVNVIEIVGCCEEAAADLVPELGSLLPDAKIVTISQIVATQVTVNRLMGRLSYVFFGILLLVGGASIASVMYANVSERKRELGTLMALGASPTTLMRLVLFKASLLGLLGGVAGILVGAILAVALGPRLLDVNVSPSWMAPLVGIAAAIGVSLLASYLPARTAARLDPCTCFREG